MITNIHLVIATGILAIIGGAAHAAQDEMLTFVQKEADWVSLHIWVPVAALDGQIPSGVTPARLVFDPAEPNPPGTMVDAYLFIRSGRYLVPFAGKNVEEEMVDAFLVIAVDRRRGQDSAPVADRAFDFYLVEYYSDNQVFRTILQQAGIHAKQLEGTYVDTTLPNSSEQAEVEISLDQFENLKLLARSIHSRHYEFSKSTMRLFFSAGEELRYIEIPLNGDFYYRAASQLENFIDNSPFDRWQDWRWAQKDTLIFYTRDSVHIVKK